MNTPPRNFLSIKVPQDRPRGEASRVQVRFLLTFSFAIAAHGEAALDERSVGGFW